MTHNTRVYGSPTYGPENAQTIAFGENSPVADAFHKLRVSQPVTLFAQHFVYPPDPGVWIENIVGSGSNTHVPAKSHYELSTTTASGDKVTHQTRQYMPYQPGKSQMFVATGVIGASKTNVEQRIGLFDDDNGLFFQQTGSGMQLVVRTNTSGSVVETVVDRADWNLDRMDGTGPSGINLDFTKTLIFVIDYQWLGVGRVRYGFDVQGKIYYCHAADHVNSLDVVYMQTPVLPVRYEIENVGTAASATTLVQICSTVISEGGYDIGGYYHSVPTGDELISVPNQTPTGLIAIRAKLTFQSKTNRMLITHIDPDLMSLTTPAEYYFLFDPTITGGSWVSVSTHSGVEYNTTFTSFSGGTRLMSGPISGTRTTSKGAAPVLDIMHNSPLALNYDGTVSTTLLLVATGLRSLSADVYASLNWQEYQ